MNKQEIRTLLSMDIHPAWQQAEEKLLEPILLKFAREEEGYIRSDNAGKQITQVMTLRLIEFLAREIRQQSEMLENLRHRHAEFTQRYSRSVSDDERRFNILEYARALGRNSRDMAEDKRAFDRWFGMDAMVDRYTRQHTRCERMISFCLGRLGSVAAMVICQSTENANYSAMWKKLDLEEIVKPLLVHDGDHRVVIEAFRCLSTALQALPASEQENAVGESTLQFIYRSALESRQQIWVQCEALNLLQSLSLSSLQRALQQRLSEPQEGDDLFLRRRAVMLLGKNILCLPDMAGLIPFVIGDPSAYVRQALPSVLHDAADETVLRWLAPLLLEDSSPQVRAAMLLELPGMLKRDALFEDIVALLQTVSKKERDAFVLRVVLKVMVDGYTRLENSSPVQAAHWHAGLLPMLNHLHRNADNFAVRRWAAQASEQLWCLSNPSAKNMFMQLKAWVATQKAGKRCKIPAEILSGSEPANVGRVLSVLAQNDFGFDVLSRAGETEVVRGHKFVMRLWRLLHEFRNPSPDKRQAFRHTIGRIFFGNVRAPSAILAELAETKVPGEPLFMAGEAGWRPYLPLVDDMVSALDAPGGKVNVFSSEGVTEIIAPRDMQLHLKARWSLANRFAQLSRMRNWQEQGQTSPAVYIHALQKMGFEVCFHPHTDASGKPMDDPAVSRFFAAGVVMPLGEFWQRMEDYFFSVYQNSLNDLAVFTLLALAYFVGKHYYTSWRIRKARANLPLVIGGWGTRGKSGTERIKAAMLNALGYGLVSKTTGCEAMFLYADPYGKMREMFLFRPYDKATIWEQFDVMVHAEGLGADIFLWECMALTPAYVRILQHHWVRDDISTITNTFPDHEDLQGPAGVNIPEVMTNFIPQHSTLITTEEQMLPILRESAKELETRVEEVGWLEAGLLTPDVLQRFPYDEHPNNIALVMRMGQELGIEPDFALKEMADRVVPDLGVLKTYPIAKLHGRRLLFVNGMSANERFGCLGNWVRMGFDKHDAETEPGVWISTVVNNRADRVARSQVFAGILVNDISADRHFLIGSNLHGLSGYIEDAWNKFALHLTLWPEAASGKSTQPMEVLQGLARRYRVATSEVAVRKRLRAMLQGLGMNDADDCMALWQQPALLTEKLGESGMQEYAADVGTALQRLLDELNEYTAFASRIEKAMVSEHDRLDHDVRQLLHTWLKRRIVVVEDFHATGDAIINVLRRETPPGVLNKVMGIQNIKGTGLDFIYRWQAWDVCFKACEKLRSEKQGVMEQGLRELAFFQEFGLLCEEYVRETIALARHSSLTQRETFQAELNVIESNLEQALEKVHSKMNIVRQSGWMMTVLESVEAFLDAGDAVKRRKTADQIYRDLISERISIERAVLELQALNKRQKGGWLLGQLYQMKNYLNKRSEEGQLKLP